MKIGKIDGYSQALKLAREAIWFARSLQCLEIVLGDSSQVRASIQGQQKGLDPLGVILIDIKKEAANFQKIEFSDVDVMGIASAII